MTPHGPTPSPTPTPTLLLTTPYLLLTCSQVMQKVRQEHDHAVFQHQVQDCHPKQRLDGICSRLDTKLAMWPQASRIHGQSYV